ncbi:MAG: CHAT domain-containing tetratricopeptide repeat protein [Bacteroidota bacterium]
MKSESATTATDSLALSLYLQVIASLNKEKNYNSTLSDSYLKCGILKMSAGNQESALFFLRKSVAVAAYNNNLPDSLLFKPFLYIGSIQYDLNNLDSAVYFYKNAEIISLKYASLNESERLYNKFGALYYETGDYKKSIGYFEKALSIVTARKPLNAFFVVNYKNNIATALLKMGDYKRALQIFNEILPYHIAEDQLFYNTGNAYTEEEEYTKALQYFRQVNQMELEKYNSMAKVFIRLKQYDSASAYISKAEHAFLDKRNQTKKFDYGITLKYKGDLEIAMGNTNAAITFYQSAITHLDPIFTDTNINSNPASFAGLRNFAYLFDALVAKASAFNKLYETLPDIKFLQQALNAYTSALELSRHVERTYFSDDARLFLKNKVNPATSDAIETAIGLWRKSDDKHYEHIALDFAENNKASVLQNGLRDLELLSIPGLPAKLVAEEKKYKSLLAKLTVQSNYLQDSVSAAALQKKIYENEMLLAAVQEKLDENPAYHQLKFNGSAINISNLQKVVTTDEIILSYYYTKKRLLCFYITNDSTGVSSTDLDKLFFSNIQYLRNGLENPEASSVALLKKVSSALFTKLIRPVQNIIKNKKRLVIIPFNEISYLPFEMMRDDADGSMLLDKYAISYQYAAAFLADKSNDPIHDYNVLAMAPFSIKNSAGILPSLPASADEINHLPGKLLFGEAATRQQFITLSDQFPVIHLATHAMANDTNLLGSYIEFYGTKRDADTMHRLYEPEIYALDLNSARLVILSACETGNGLLVNGEGVMSLSRAFSYAGCKSVVTSLWKADDIATAFIMKRLHYYLQKGFSKDEALQKAKLDYLKSSAVDDRYKIPAYWAHLILIGDYHPLVQKKISWYLPAVLLILMLVMFVVVRKKSRV